MKRPQFENGHFYHIYNRGVEKRITFNDDFDYLRAIHDLFEFNDDAPAGRFSGKRSEVQPPKIRRELVRIHSYCLMPNHYHFLLEQIQNDGIVQFMKKFGTGYTMFFNEKYHRVGPLFQGRFKAILIEEDSYLLHLSRYIHLNPVDLIEPDWKKMGIKDWERTNNFLESYRWSSYLDYIGDKNFPSLITKEFINLLLDPEDGSKTDKYKKFVYEWMAKDYSLIDNLVLE